MCEGLWELREALQAYASSFDARLLTGAAAALAMKEAAAIEAVAANLKALAAARVDDTGAWQGQGDRSAAHHLARTTGTSVTAATEALSTARRLEALPELAGAARRGELSVRQCSIAADAATADATAEHQLVSAAKKGSVAGRGRPPASGKAPPAAGPDARHPPVAASRPQRSH